MPHNLSQSKPQVDRTNTMYRAPFPIKILFSEEKVMKKKS
jgi:hypothetical protein